MNTTIIDNINAMVGYNDTLYHLGDFAFGDKKQIPNLRRRIKCKNIILLQGNHDGKLWSEYREEFARTEQYVELRVGSTKVCMFHYPIAAWNENGRGAINLHGHSHGNYKAVGRQMDVGVDCCGFAPMALETIVEQMQLITPVAVDHHTTNTNYH